MRRETLIALLLSGILATYEMPLASETLKVIRAGGIAGIIQHRSQMAFTSATGMDMDGTQVALIDRNSKIKTLLFVIRGETATADIDFWSKVDSDRHNEDELRLIGFCDGLTCEQTVRQHVGRLPFPVIQFAEIGSTQELFDQDDSGNALLRRGTSTEPFSWRVPGSTPHGVLEKLSR